MQIYLMKTTALIFAYYLILFSSFPDDFFPRNNWKDQLNPLAGPDAEVGGNINIFAGQNPQSFNYYLDNNSFSAELFSAMYDTLLSRNPLTLVEEPLIAEKWSISDDKSVFTFWLDKKAKWSDGTPITAADIKWTFDTIMNPGNLTGVHKVSLEKFHSPKIIDSHQISFTAREVHWSNLLAIGALEILPKHSFEKQDFNKINFEFPVVSGLYKIGEVRELMYVKLVRRSNYWNKAAKRSQGTGNFQTLTFKFFADRQNAFEAFKKGQIDLYPVYTARLWVNETKGEKFDKNWIVKQKVYNYSPVGFQGFAMNMRKPIFSNIKVRQAMAHLLDREKMNKTLMYDQYFLHKSYYEDLYSDEAPCTNEFIKFDKDKARQLLKEAGWQGNPKTGILEKDGIPFRFKFLTRDMSVDKFLSIYSEDLKDVGIKLEINRKDWAAWSKDMDQFNFDMTWVSWGASLYKDPEGMWASKEADRKAGNNVTGFKNEDVDKFIDQQKRIFDIQTRHRLAKKVDKIVYHTYPYVLLWNINYTRLLYWNKFGMPQTVLDKYGREKAAYSYWWYDEDSAADLEDAMDQKVSLPPKPLTVQFDTNYK